MFSQQWILLFYKFQTEEKEIKSNIPIQGIEIATGGNYNE
jgi:hypothetical protein